VYVVLYGPHAKSRFRALHADRAAIETELQSQLIWREMPDRKESQVRMEHACDFDHPESWEPVLRWVATTLDRMDAVFRCRVRVLRGADEAAE
jgi:hypothetical protein